MGDVVFFSLFVQKSFVLVAQLETENYLLEKL
jgi:hypothetical protein